MRRLLSLFAVLALSLSLACGEDDTTMDGTVKADTSTDGVAPDTSVPDMATDGMAPPAEYKFVKIEDLATLTSQYQDGADIDAVELDKSGTSTWAASVESCTLPDGSDCDNKEKATGASDAFCGTDTTKCFSNVESPTDDPTTIPPYVSLGGLDSGTSGTLIVQMSDKIENGDKLNIYELGNCDIATTCNDTSTSQATPESIKVSVGTSATGPWIEVLAASDTNNHPKIEITVSGL